MTITNSCRSLTGASRNLLKPISLEAKQIVATIGIGPAVSLAFTEGIGLVKDSIALDDQLTFHRLDAIVVTGCRGTRTSWHGFRGVALETSQSSLTMPVTLALPLTFTEKIRVWRPPKILHGWFIGWFIVWFNIGGIDTVVRPETKWTFTTAGHRFK